MLTLLQEILLSKSIQAQHIYSKTAKAYLSYDFEIKGAKVFATCNEISRLSKPLQSRFRRLHLPPYTEEQFLDVSAKVLPNLKIAQVIGKAVWNQRGDIQDVISIGKLVRKNDGPAEVESIINTMGKYRETVSRKSSCE
jgi:hypothetical protein